MAVAFATAKHNEDGRRSPQANPIVTQGDGKSDIMSVFREIPGVGAVIGVMHVAFAVLF
jgi:hypothetical protein